MTIFTADWLLPISAAPIEHGAIAVENKKIVGVGTKRDIQNQFPNTPCKDFGEAAILPGFVNAHAHLELTALRGFLDSVENDFPTWLIKLASARDGRMTPEGIANSALCGAIEAVRAGVTAIGDIGKHGFAGTMALRATGMRGVSFQENSFALGENLAAEKFAELKEKVRRNKEFETDCVRVGITPHAAYTVSRKLFEMITDFALQENLPVTIHAAESNGEIDFMFSGAGKIGEIIKNLGVEWKAPKISTIQYLKETGVLNTKPLLAHCVNVDETDLEIIAATNSKIAHCPKSNAKFAHGIAPFSDFVKRNLIVGLGSDSVASNNSCDILDEARTAAFLQRAKGNFIEPETVLKAATIGGATALGLEKCTGTLEAGKLADFTVISLAALPQQPIYDVYAAVVFASTARDVIFTCIDGRTIYENGEVKTVDERAAKARLKETARRIVQ